MRYVLPLSSRYPTAFRCFYPPDVIGIVSEVGDLATISTKANRTVSVIQLFTLLWLTVECRPRKENSRWLIAPTHQSGSPFGGNRLRPTNMMALTLSSRSKV